jgi:uncharacterized protein (UPF0264 family)
VNQRLLVSVRGKNEAIAAWKGGAKIIDVEYPASALGTPYPLNIAAVRGALPKAARVSTNIGEEQPVRGTACQAAIGVAVAGAHYVKAGLARLGRDEAEYLGLSIVRSVRRFARGRKIYPAFFADPEHMKTYLDPIEDGPAVAAAIRANGVLIDTFDKEAGEGLIDYVDLKGVQKFVRLCHASSIEAWVAGSITLDQLPKIWRTGVDVVCVRGAACVKSDEGRFGQVDTGLVRELVATIPESSR